MDAVGSAATLVSATSIAETKCCILRIIYTILKTFLFLLFMVFILCVPMGDPDHQCRREVCYEPQSKAVAYSYMCNIYKAMSSTVLFTTDSVHKASQFASCVLINAMYDAKLKFYNILETIDGKDLCKSICCMDSDEVESQTNIQKDKTTCKCKVKHCKRQAKQRT